MPWLGLFGVAFVGTLFWVANPEVAAAFCASRRGWPPVLIGLVAASGQLCAQALLFAFGAQLRRRWRWFDRQCTRVRERHRDRLQTNATVVLVSSGLLGVPPVSVTATLAPGLGLSAARVLPLLFAMRVVRFVAVAALAAQIK
jgi:membrane protein YqaA with SNARE-associated domain